MQSRMVTQLFLAEVFGIQSDDAPAGAEYLLDLTLTGDFLTQDDFLRCAGDPELLVTTWDRQVIDRLNAQWNLGLEHLCVPLEEAAQKWAAAQAS